MTDQLTTCQPTKAKEKGNIFQKRGKEKGNRYHKKDQRQTQYKKFLRMKFHKPRIAQTT